MICEKCNKEISTDDKYCQHCGAPTKRLLAMWWERLAVVIYAATHLVIFFFVLFIWADENFSAESFFFGIISMFMLILFLRGIKSAIRYVIKARQPSWSDLLHF